MDRDDDDEVDRSSEEIFFVQFRYLAGVDSAELVMGDGSTLPLAPWCVEIVLKGVGTLKQGAGEEAPRPGALAATAPAEPARPWFMAGRCAHVFLLQKWITSLQYRHAYLQSLPRHELEMLGECTIDSTLAEHELTHHGETPHTLRHWVRGGNVKLMRSKEPVGYGDKGAEQWLEMISGLEKAVSVNRPSTPPGELTVGVARAHKINHTDLHCMQVPHSLDAFCAQLDNEFRFPTFLMATPGYNDVLLEVSSRWQGLASGARVGAILWVRHVADGNRAVLERELKGCFLAAKATAKKDHVLVLGDRGGFAWAGGSERNVTCLLGEHMVSAKGKARSQLEQLQFFTAICQVTRAPIVLGERTGSVDKIALCGGMACGQFVGLNVRAGNDRLPAVYASGCGMGNMIDLAAFTKEKEISEAMAGLAVKALAARAMLERAMQKWRRG